MMLLGFDAELRLVPPRGPQTRGEQELAVDAWWHETNRDQDKSFS